MCSDRIDEKYGKLIEYLKSLKSVAVAYSSGVDSTFLLYAAKEALGENVIAVTASSCMFPKRELDETIEYCNKLGVRHYVVQADELKIDGFAQNPPNRCYLCKKDLMGKIIDIAGENGMSAVIEGSNVDDSGDYRPGAKAIKELGIISPLKECDFSKQDIRDMSQKLDIHTWNKPSFACLSSRFAYGETITEEKLGMVDRAEQYLMDMGFRQFRVRIHGTIARIELESDDIDRFLEKNTRIKVYEQLKGYGFSYVTLDLLGYRMGSMNEVLNV